MTKLLNTSVAFTVSLPVALLVDTDRAAVAQGKTRSQFIREALREHLDAVYQGFTAAADERVKEKDA